MNPTYKVAPDAKGAVFVRSNTKNIQKLDQADMEILFKNKDPRIQLVDSTEQTEKTESVAEIIEAVSDFIKPVKVATVKKPKVPETTPSTSEPAESAAIPEVE